MLHPFSCASPVHPIALDPLMLNASIVFMRIPNDSLNARPHPLLPGRAKMAGSSFHARLLTESLNPSILLRLGRFGRFAKLRSGYPLLCFGCLGSTGNGDQPSPLTHGFRLCGSGVFEATICPRDGVSAAPFLTSSPVQAASELDVDGPSFGRLRDTALPARAS